MTDKEELTEHGAALSFLYFSPQDPNLMNFVSSGENDTVLLVMGEPKTGSQPILDGDPVNNKRFL